MKKIKFMLILTLLCTVGVLAYTFSVQLSSSKTSLLFIQNVEALTSGESSDTCVSGGRYCILNVGTTQVTSNMHYNI